VDRHRFQLTANSGMFMPETFAPVRRPLDEASTLPGFCYTSREWYERELETIFLKEWLCVGRAEQLASAGDYFAVNVVGEPIVVVRDQEGQLRAHSAVCRHRGTELVTGEGKARAFVCPYHSWTYALDGRLLGTPGIPAPMDAAKGFCTDDFGLIPIRLETWGGFLFVNLDPDARPLLSCLGDMPERFEPYHLETMRQMRRWAFEAPFNWKIYVENARESYHQDTVHRKQYTATKRPARWIVEPTGDAYVAMYSSESLWIPETPIFEPIPGLPEKERRGTYLVLLYPAFLLALSPTHMGYMQVYPDGPAATRVVLHVCFPGSVAARADLEEMAEPLYAAVDGFAPEDLDVCPRAQRGLGSRLYRGGRFAPVAEPLVHRFANYVVDRVVPAAPARATG
jgi:choline monooxygenase